MGMKTAMITGASTGIGAEFAKVVANDFDRLILTARNRDALKKLACSLEKKHQIKCDVIVSDLSSEKGVVKLTKYLTDNNIELDLIVNNAGFGLMGNAADLSHKAQMDMVSVNVSALTRLSLFAAQSMKKAGSGGIINIASIVGFMPGPTMSVYFASKAYVVSFCESLSVELENYGITVTCVCPGATESEFHMRAGLPITNSRKAAMMSSDTVAEMGYASFKAGRSLVVTGRANKLVRFFTRFLPRRLLARLVIRALS